MVYGIDGVWDVVPAQARQIRVRVNHGARLPEGPGEYDKVGEVHGAVAVQIVPVLHRSEGPGKGDKVGEVHGAVAVEVGIQDCVYLKYSQGQKKEQDAREQECAFCHGQFLLRAGIKERNPGAGDMPTR